MKSPPQTIEELRRETIVSLVALGFSQASLEVDYLLQKVTGKSALQLILHHKEILTSEQHAQFQSFLQRRLKHEPLAYILGEREFMGLPFFVNPSVLIPRPDTEILVEAAEEFLKRLSHERSLSVLDLGTGSGCIALSLLARVPSLTVEAWDVSEEALRTAEANEKRLNLVSSPVMWKHKDILDEGSWNGEPRFDLIVSNPPYIGREESQDLPREVLSWEPHGALFANDAGLQFYKRIAELGNLILRPHGKIMVEIGFAQGQVVSQIFETQGWTVDTMLKDLGQKDRVVVFSLTT